MKNYNCNVYWHVGNGGFTFSINNEHGPTFKISSSFFGHTVNEMKIFTDINSLIGLRDMIDNAIKNNEFDEGYCEKAHIRNE